MAIWSNVYLTRPAVPRIDTQKAEGKAHDCANACECRQQSWSLGCGRRRGPAHALQNRARIVIDANGQDLPIYHVKAVDHRDGAERSIEIKDGGAPLAIYYVPVNLDAFNGREKSSENRSHRGRALNGRTDGPYELDVLVKWRRAYIS